jgi:hypothetical protein
VRVVRVGREGEWALTARAVWGECTHVFHMHCLLKWIATPSSKQQCPMDRRSWGALPYSRRLTTSHPSAVTAERKVAAE